MNILFVASELSPYAKTGGLGDVMGALPATLRKRGHSVSIVVPLYRSIRQSLPHLQPTTINLPIVMGEDQIRARIWQGQSETGVSVFAIERDEFFDRSNIYGDGAGDYFDNAVRFIFFSKAALDMAGHLSPRPEVIHVNDWHTGLIPALVKSQGLTYKTVFTIHNLAYQGIFSSHQFFYTNLAKDYFTMDGLEYYGQINLMKSGILYTDAVTTVSPTYAKEIQTPRYGHGLHPVLHDRREKLQGILNGIDAEIWNPETDPHLAANYSSGNMQGKELCKKDLLSVFHFEGDPETPLIGCVSRLVGQKGFALLREAADRILKLPLRLVVLGSGDRELETFFTELEARYPKKVRVRIGFDEKLAHQIEAGADFFLMPSVFEPCGLNQMYSQRYGTIPIVHATGGLEDSVDHWNAKTSKGNGLKFHSFDPEALLTEIQRGLRLIKNAKAWNSIRNQAMTRDLAWTARAPEYEKLYQSLKSG